MTASKQISFCVNDTIVYLGPDDSFASEVRELCTELNVKLCLTDIITDVIAIPSFLCIICPISLCNDNLTELGSWLAEMNDPSVRVLFTEKCGQHHIPSRNLIRNPDQLDTGFLKFLILRTRARIKRGKAAWERAERRIVRMMHMIRSLTMAEASVFLISRMSSRLRREPFKETSEYSRWQAIPF